MTWPRLVVLALLLVTLGVLLLNMSTVVDILGIEGIEGTEPEVVQEGPLSFVQSSRLRRTVEEAGRWPVAIFATLFLLPLWLATSGAAAVVWWVFVKRQEWRDREALELARKRTAWTWSFLVGHAHRLAGARSRDEQERRAQELRRELYAHLHVLEARDRNRLVRFLQHLALLDGTLDALRDPDDDEPDRWTEHPLETAVQPAILFLAVTSLFLIGFGTVAGVQLLTIQELVTEISTQIGIIHYGPHETSMAMLMCYQLALLAACAASGLRVLHRRGREERERRDRIEREDRQVVLQQVEGLVDRLGGERRSGGGPPAVDPALPKIVEAVVVLLLPELDGTDKGRLVGSLAEGGLLAGDVDLRTADLSGVDLAGADLPGVVLAGCDLDRARLSATRLTGADLAGARLEEADLSGADLRGADLYRAVLWYARLQAADLRDARMVEAALDGANLWNADLRGADLEGARVTAEQRAAARPPETP